MSVLKSILNKISPKKQNQMTIWHSQYIDHCLSFIKKRKNLKCLVIGCSRGEECKIFYKKGFKNITGIDLIDEIGKNFVKNTVQYYKISAENPLVFSASGTTVVVYCSRFEESDSIVIYVSKGRFTGLPITPSTPESWGVANSNEIDFYNTSVGLCISAQEEMAFPIAITGREALKVEALKVFEEKVSLFTNLVSNIQEAIQYGDFNQWSESRTSSLYF